MILFYAFLLASAIYTLSNNITIQSQIELEEAVEKRLHALDLPGMRLSPERPLPGLSDAGVDLWVRAELDGRPTLFAVQCKLHPSNRDVERLKHAAGNTAPLLAAVHLPKPLLERCRQLGVSCLDLNGNLYLRQPGLIVDWERPAKRFRSPDPERNLFSGKSSRLARVLLSFPDRRWKQSELAQTTECSGGLISRLAREYARLGWVEGSWGDWTLTQADALLDAWAAADNWNKRGTLRQYSCLERDPEKLARKFLQSSRGKIAFTQWFAAEHRHPYTELPVVSVYRPQFPEPAILEALDLREVPNGGRLWVIVPHDEGVFQATREANGFPLVCDIQIHLDLLQVGLRGPDAARALRQWEGFRR